MKKTILLFIGFINLMIFVNAQKSSFGIAAGATFASYKVDFSGIAITSDSKVGYTFGLLSSFPVGKSFDFQPALHFVQQGGTLKQDSYEDKLTLNGIEIPMNFVYHTKDPKGSFFVGAGPSISWGISGKYKYDDGTTENVKFGSSPDDDFKPFQLGANFLTGYHFKKGFMIAANYNFSLTNTANNDPDFPDAEATYHNRYWGLRLGYMFQGKKK